MRKSFLSLTTDSSKVDYLRKSKTFPVENPWKDSLIIFPVKTYFAQELVASTVANHFGKLKQTKTCQALFAIGFHSTGVNVPVNVIPQQELLISFAALMIIVSQIQIQQIWILYQFVIVMMFMYLARISASVTSSYNCAWLRCGTYFWLLNSQAPPHIQESY